MAIAVVGGGRRSGKSRYAQALASANGPRLAFIGTLQALDDESIQKVETARRERGPAFITSEEYVDLRRAIAERLSLFDAIIVDDLTIWVSNMMMSGHSDEETEAEFARLLETAAGSKVEVVFVMSDVDFGFPMDGEESRRFRRLAGLINRLAAEAASRLYWMVFGVPKRIR